MYFKIGQADADLKAVTVMLQVILPGELIKITCGDLMWGIGTTSIASLNGLFIKTEAGAIQYDQFSITGIGGK